MTFYEDLSSFYDDMINFKERLETEKQIFEKILTSFPAKSVLDAGCGSGFHSVVLSSLGLSVTGMDNSAPMLELAKKNSKDYNQFPKFVKKRFPTSKL